MSSIKSRGMSACHNAELTGFNGKEYEGPLDALSSLFIHNGQRRSCFEGEEWENYGRAWYCGSFAYDIGRAAYRNSTRTKSRARRINALKKYIDKHDLGTMEILPDSCNPVHSMDSVSRAFIYAPKQKAVWEHLQASPKGRKILGKKVESPNW